MNERTRNHWLSALATLGTSALFAWFLVYAVDRLIS